MFEWDETKRQRNLAKHGIDFVAVLAAFGDPQRIEVEDRRRDYGETRRVILCPVHGRLLHITYTLRGTVRRLISVRKANQRERRLYERYRNHDEGDPQR